MDLKFNPPQIKIDKPHEPFGRHVDHIHQISGVGAEKMRINERGDIMSHELLLKGGKKINL